MRIVTGTLAWQSLRDEKSKYLQGIQSANGGT
jgi:hypothetical protein